MLEPSPFHCSEDSLSKMEAGRLGVGRSFPIQGWDYSSLSPGSIPVCDTRRYLGTLSEDG